MNQPEQNAAPPPQNAAPPQHSTSAPDGRTDNILGLSTNALAGLSVEKIVGDETAITMLMHYYKQLVDDNNALKNERNTYKTYVDSYRSTKNNVIIGTVLLTLSNIFIGFGVNLITGNHVGEGTAIFIPGVCLALAGLFFSLKGPT